MDKCVRYPLFFQCMALLALLGMLPIFFFPLGEVRTPQEKVWNRIISVNHQRKTLDIPLGYAKVELELKTTDESQIHVIKQLLEQKLHCHLN